MNARMRRRLKRRVDAPPAPDAKREKQLVDYWRKSKSIMEQFDRLTPYQRALINFFGADVIARLPQNIAPEDVPKRLGKTKEFAEYWSEFSRPTVERQQAEQARQVSAWDGILT